MKSHYLVLLMIVSLISARTVTKRIKHSKHKRGIHHGGYHGFGLHSHLFPATTGFGFGVSPFRYPDPWPATSVYSNFASIAKPLAPIAPLAPAIPTTQYALTHGNAAVQSYNVNYPRLPFVQHHKQIFAQPTFTQAQIPQFIQTFQQTYPQFITAPAVQQPILPAPIPAAPLPLPSTSTFFIPQKPIIPVAVPAVQSVNRPLLAQKPIAPVLPAVGFNPILQFASFQPQFIPIPIPTTTTTLTPSLPIPTETPTTTTTTTTTQSNPIGQSGTNFVTNINPDRPSFIGQQPDTSSTHFLPTPTQPTFSNYPRPHISLLPPYLGPTGPGFGTNIMSTFTPTNVPDIDDEQRNFNQNNNNNINNNNNHEFFQGNNNFNNNQNVNHNQQGYPSGPFNGQRYGPPANNGRFTGPSSYQVRLNTRTNF